MKKNLGYFLLIFSIFTIISSCNNNPYIKDHIQGEDFIINKNADLHQAVQAMIEISGIKKGGYVTILPVSDVNMKNVKTLQKKLYKQNIIAVHILSLKTDSAILKTDSLTLENATIICLLGKDSQMILNSENHSQTNSSISKAKENGALIARIE